MASFKYDALGRRIQKTITVTGTVTDTMYLYDGLDIVQEKDASEAVTVNYIRTLNIDEPVARISSDGTVRYYQQDALGSVIGLTTENGQLSTIYSYDPFGNTTVSGEASDNPFQYIGRENDGTGLYYYRARYYSPELQRFISEDPIRFESGDVNFSAYVGNKPVNRKDPIGLWSISIEGYFGLGGGIVFGKNPCSGSFVTWRIGYGIGGGVSYNPKGSSPGWEPSKKHHGLGVGAGGFARANVGLGPAYAGIGGNAGVNVSYQRVDPYARISPEYGPEWGWHLRVGAAAGGEITLY